MKKTIDKNWDIISEMVLLKIKISPNYAGLAHELAHIVLIKNFQKLLIDNWNQPAIYCNLSKQTREKFLINESRVWGVENFQYREECKRTINQHFVSYYVKDKEAIEFSNKCKTIMNRHDNEMTFPKFMNELEIRLQFISNHIKNNPDFNSKVFNMWN